MKITVTVDVECPDDVTVDLDRLRREIGDTVTVGLRPRAVQPAISSLAKRFAMEGYRCISPCQAARLPSGETGLQALARVEPSHYAEIMRGVESAAEARYFSHHADAEGNVIPLTIAMYEALWALR